jgi:hypothetical protein
MPASTIPLENPASSPVTDAINTYSNRLSSSLDIQRNALARQNEVKNILVSETDRLANKKKTIDDALKSQGRIIFFNDNSRKRYAAFLKIIITVALILAIIFVLNLLQTNFDTVFPYWLWQILIILLITGSFIYIWTLFVEIKRHSNYNFDELNLEAPEVANKDLSSANATSSPISVSGLAGKWCVDDSCCDVGTTWNESAGKCVPGTSIPTKQGFTTQSIINPVDAFEYSEYAPYK